MKTKEEIFKEHNIIRAYKDDGVPVGEDKEIVGKGVLYRPKCDYYFLKFDLKDLIGAMDEYASLRESKWRELREAWKELIEILTEHKDLRMPNVYWGRKTELRQKITLIEQELGLTK